MYKTKMGSGMKRAGWAFCSLYFLIGISQFFGTSYISLYIHSFPFVDGFAVGLIMAIQYITGAAGQFLWGNLADQTRSRNSVLSVVLSGLFFSAWILILPGYQSVFPLMLSVMFLNIFLLVPLSLFDTITVENKDRCRLSFSSMRGFSSAGSAAAAFFLFLLGTVSSSKIQPKTGLIVMAFSAAAGILPLSFIPKTSGRINKKQQKRREEIGHLLQNREFILLLLFGLCNFCCTGAYVSYFAIYFTSSGGLNGGLEMLNLFSAICIAGESILIIVCGRVFRKKDIYWIFTWVSVMGAFRSISVFLSPDPRILMCTFMFQGLMFGPLWGRAAPYIGSIVKEEVRATAQAIWSIFVQGIGPACGAVIGGVISRFVGLKEIFLVISCMHLSIVLIFLYPFHRQRLLKKNL